MSTPAPSTPPPTSTPSARAARMKMLFTVINADDVPVYAADLTNTGEAGEADVRANSTDATRDAERDDYVFELIARGALDFVDERSWESNAAYLKVVDRFNDVNVYAYVTSTQIKFILCAEMRADEPIRAFFADVHEGYCVAMMNPMRDEDAALDTSAAFRRAVRAAARKRLGVGA